MIRKLLVPALALGFITTPALAEKQVWRTGEGFTIRAGDLDLGARGGRAALLQRVEFAAARMCQEVTPRIDRHGCAAQLVERTLASAPPAMRTAIAAARIERDAPRLAGR